MKISKRPSSMAKVQIQVWKSLSTANVVDGPTRFSPGPVLLSVAATAEKAVTKSSPLADISNVRLTKLAVYTKPKAITPVSTFSGMTEPRMRTSQIALGCMARNSSR